MIDIDFFKNYNDNYGHLSGDACLKAVAETIAGVVRDPPDFAARYGGEEFVCILPNTGVDGLTAVAQRIQDSIHRRQLPHAFSSVANHVTISMGGAYVVPQGGTDSELLIQVADTRLYKAKHNGRNRWLIDD